MLNFLLATMALCLFFIPTVLAAAPALFAPNKILTLVGIGFAPLIFLICYPLIAGIYGMMFKKSIIKGRFERVATDKVYFGRRLYGFGWTAVFYFKPVYWLWLSFPVLRNLLFAMFGYQGAKTFTLQPDTWIRDLPMLNFGPNAYIANRATLGTNMCLADGTILVDQLTVGPYAMVGHLALVGPGSVLEERAEVGVGAAIGIRARLKQHSKVGVSCMVNHGASVGQNASVGNHSFIGLRAEIGNDIEVPAGANIPAGIIIKNQDELNQYISSETRVLNAHAQELASLYATG